jgi:hypothetical protein
MKANTTKKGGNRAKMEGGTARGIQWGVDRVGNGTMLMERRTGKLIPLRTLLHLCAVGSPKVRGCDYLGSCL